jgi:hypothetical protein
MRIHLDGLCSGRHGELLNVSAEMPYSNITRNMLNSRLLMERPRKDIHEAFVRQFGQRIANYLSHV